MVNYEFHVTVEKHPTMKQANDFASFATAIKCKPLLIELSSGRFPLQLMLAERSELSSDEAAIRHALALNDIVTAAGWKIVRSKVESTLMPGVATYFEAHWKLLLKNEDSRQKWTEFLKKTPGFLASKNIFERGKFYLSQRTYYDASAFPTDQHLFANNVFSDVERHQIIPTFGHKHAAQFDGGHYERVLLDSNPGLDAGWVVS